jgi:hypothetical protein
VTPRTTSPGTALPLLIPAPPPRARQHGPDPAAVRCYYAGDPARRPHCALTAEIALGPVALCSPCAAARSTLGKGTVPAALPPGPQIDVLDWVADADAAVRQASRDLAAAVTRARSRGRTWTQIAGRLGITRQAAQQRFSREPGPHALPGPPPVTANRR